MPLSFENENNAAKNAIPSNLESIALVGYIINLSKYERLRNLEKNFIHF